MNSETLDKLVLLVVTLADRAKVDGDAVALYADLWVWLKDCRSFISKHGESFPTYDGDGNLTGYRQYPQVPLAVKLAAQVARLEAELGLTPSGRSRLQVAPPEDPNDPLAYFIQAGVATRNRCAQPDPNN